MPVRKRKTKSLLNNNEGSSNSNKIKKSPPSRNLTKTKSSSQLSQKQLTHNFKKINLPLPIRPKLCSYLLTLGQGDTGQLGLGPNTMSRKKPALSKNESPRFVSTCAGGMHSVILMENGSVQTFGCNDEGALGRQTEDEDDCFLPGLATLPLDADVASISAGDSHTAVLTTNGQVYYCGTFRNGSGSFGLTLRGIELIPIALNLPYEVVQIASGCEHLVLLTSEGLVYTIGCGEQGQLGRLGPRSSCRETRLGPGKFLKPQEVIFKRRPFRCDKIWAGSYNTMVRTVGGEIFAFGLNNYGQLGVPLSSDGCNCIYTPVKVNSLMNHSWEQIAFGQHHTICLDKDGQVYTLGRCDYGRLGLGHVSEPMDSPKHVQGLLAGKKCVQVSAGTAVSYAVADDGQVFSWGMGSTAMLGTEGDEDIWQPVQVSGKNLVGRKVVAISGGGQHTTLLAVDGK